MSFIFQPTLDFAVLGFPFRDAQGILRRCRLLISGCCADTPKVNYVFSLLHGAHHKLSCQRCAVSCSDFHLPCHSFTSVGKHDDFQATLFFWFRCLFPTRPTQDAPSGLLMTRTARLTRTARHARIALYVEQCVHHLPRRALISSAPRCSLPLNPSHAASALPSLHLALPAQTAFKLCLFSARFLCSSSAFSYSLSPFLQPHCM